MPQSKRTKKEELFLNTEGCKRAAELYEEEVDRRDGGQDEICNAEDISPSTGTKFRRLVHGLVSTPDPSTIMRLGRQIIDPDTGRYFDPWKFLLGVCCNVEPKQLVKIALSIDPYILEEFPRPAKKPEIDLKSIEHWIQTAPTEAVESLTHLLSAKVPAAVLGPMNVELDSIEDDGTSPIANLVQSQLNQLDMRPFEFARRCGLKAADIHRVVNSSEPLCSKIAEGLAYGFSYTMEGWTADLVRKVDPRRFLASQSIDHDQELDRAIGHSQAIHA
jgi:hypothetical protein